MFSAPWIFDWGFCVCVCVKLKRGEHLVLGRAPRSRPFGAFGAWGVDACSGKNIR